jgi:hypothetical protein
MLQVTAVWLVPETKALNWQVCAVPLKVRTNELHDAAALTVMVMDVGVS